MVPVVMLLLVMSLVQTGGYHPALLDVDGKMIVYDSTREEPYCYPGANHPDKTIFKDSQEATARNIGRVLCRSLGYTHLVREYGVPADGFIGTRLLIYCQGYERLIEQCTTDRGAKNDCNELLVLECGRCSEQERQMEIGETVEITSPEYPNYTDSAVCEWHLRPPTMAAFTLEFLNFRLPSTDTRGNCYVGYLEVSKEVNGEAVEVMVRCGSAVPMPLTVKAEVLILRFSSGTFYPRPFNSKRGFRVLVTASPIPWSSRRLSTMEKVSIGLGVALFLVILLFVLFVMRRRVWTRRRSRQRKQMQQKMERPSYHEALTAMLAGIATNPARHLVTRGDNNMPEVSNRHCGSLRGGSLRDTEQSERGRRSTKVICATRTSSVPLQPTNCPPLPPRIPSSAPPPVKLHHPLPIIEGEGEPSNMEDQPIYMELDEFNKSMAQSYVELKDLERAKVGMSDSSVTGVPTSPLLVTPTARHYTSQPLLFPGQPSSSPTAEKTFPRRAHVWPSTSSLPPSVKTLPCIDKTCTGKTFTGGSVSSCIHISLSSRGSNVSLSSYCIPSLSVRLSPIHRGCATIPRGYSTTSSLSSSNFVESRWSERLPVIQMDGTPLLNTSILERQVRVASCSSSDSVFTENGSVTREQRRCACGSVHEKGNASSEKGQHLSKSCGDVSRTPSNPKQENSMNSMLELVRSEPSLPRDQTAPRLVGPVLRRVSQMFFGSSPFLSNSAEEAKDSGSDAAGDEMQPEKNGTGTWRLGKNTSRRAVSSSSGIFSSFKYSRLQNASNSDRGKANSCSDFQETSATQGAGTAPARFTPWWIHEPASMVVEAWVEERPQPTGPESGEI
ncbi:uncharacterized protein LOC123504257 isoform X3 [Portunus trituberculatus]|uniref:uncharacterized protein LOC123504257 isoform X3 n=1 Tax=Portunus trituberculatus TaxID=210409 RepID=UPI001E1D10ED|nr:uncharacterized protein LOC123504257 isoform X3 [Portunus trituberculatus]